jgi:RNA polymerase-binding transcription factor DksA
MISFILKDPRSKIDPRWKWHYRALMRLNGRLLQQRDEHQRLTDESLKECHKDPGDTSEVESEREILFAELALEEHSIAEVESALLRIRYGIRYGNYGVCEVTGKAISADRLRAIPWTRYCKDAAPRRVP